MFENRLIPGVRQNDPYKLPFVVVRDKELMLDLVYVYRGWVSRSKPIEKDGFDPEKGDDRADFESRIRMDDDRNLGVRIELIDGNLTAFVFCDAVWDSELVQTRRENRTR